VASDLVIKTAVRFPVSQVELPPSTAAKTRSVSAPPARERPAKLAVSAPKNPGHEVRNSSSYRLHVLHLPNLQNSPSQTNAQRTCELGHAYATAPGPVTLY